MALPSWCLRVWIPISWSWIRYDPVRYRLHVNSTCTWSTMPTNSDSDMHMASRNGKCVWCSAHTHTPRMKHVDCRYSCACTQHAQLRRDGKRERRDRVKGSERKRANRNSQQPRTDLTTLVRCCSGPATRPLFRPAPLCLAPLTAPLCGWWDNSEGGMIRLETLNFLNSIFSSSNLSIRGFRAYYLVAIRQTNSLSSNSSQGYLNRQYPHPLLVMKRSAAGNIYVYIYIYIYIHICTRI